MQSKGKIMSSISGVSSSGDAWANMRAQRNQMQAKMFSKVDADSSGGVDKTELKNLLSDVASKTGVSNSSSSDELFTKMDTNSDGSLSSDELGKGMQSIMPPPPSTMDFAQSRTDSSSSSSSTSGSDDLFGKVDADGNGSVSESEMKTLMDKMGMNFSSDSFAKLDTDSDGSLSATEFEAARTQGGTSAQGSSGTQAAGGMPPPPPPGGGGSATASSTTYDPLDTNQDGTVSASERLAGSTSSSSTNAVSALLKTMDTNGDSQISKDETDAFMQKLNSQLESGKATGGVDLVELVKKAYEQIANASSQQSSGSTLSATA
jgi:Ca2+-binding EF-hand superfamily protein